MSKTTDGIVVASNPTPFMKGRFNLYHTPDGGFHVAYQADPTDNEPNPEIQHMNIPGAIIRAAQMMEQGKMSPLQAFKLFMTTATGPKE